MKKFTYTLNLDLLRLNEKEKVFIAESGEKSILENILNQGLAGKYPSGMSTDKRRIYGRLLEKMDADTSGTLEIEEAEFDLIKEAIASDEARFLPEQTRLISQYLKAIDMAKE